MLGANTTQNDTGGEGCPGKGCCVFPLIMAFMLGAIFRQLFRWLRTYVAAIPPYTFVLILFGGLFAHAVNKFPAIKDYDQCLKVSGKTLVHVSLPLLVFHSTFKTEMQTFKKSINQVLFLGVTGYAIVIVLTALAVRFIFRPDWTYHTCVILGIVISCTDPLAVDDAVRVTGVSTGLAALMQGESIISDAMGMVCFKLFRLLLILSHSEVSNVYNREITIFIVQCMFAPAYGVFTAILTVFWVSRIYNDSTLEITIVLSVLHLAYYTSELLRLPGMVTVLFFGLYLSSSRSSISRTVEDNMKKSFRVLTDIHNSVQFFYAGVFIVTEGLSNLTPMVVLHNFLIWIVVSFNRAIMVFFLSPVLRRLGLGMSWEHGLTVWIAGLNGSFNILLCQMATADLHFINDMSKDITLQSANVFFQTVMSQIILRQVFNTTITRFVLRAFGLRYIPKFHQMSLATAMRRLQVTRNQTINSLKSDRFMADAAFDIVDAETQTDDMFKHFSQKKLNLSAFLKRLKSKNSILSSNISPDEEEQKEDTRESKTEAIQMLLKAQKKTYWELFNRGLMSKEALHQLIEWADTAADHKGRFLDVRKVKEACEVTPILKSLKRQVRIKLRQLQHQKASVNGWLYWQQQVMQTVLSYGFHILDTVAIILAIFSDIYKFRNPELNTSFASGFFIWNCIVVSLYGMIAIGELLVMRLRFFKIVWHDITFAIVLMGLVDLLVMSVVSGQDDVQQSLSFSGRLFIRLFFIISRAIRLLGLVESVPWVLRKFGKLLEQRISNRLVVGFDICCAFVTGQGQVIRQLDSLVSEPTLRQELKHTCNRQKMDIIRTLGTLALENPTIALSVKTRQAMRIVLNSQHDTVMQLKEEGAIQDTDAGLLSKDLEERMKRLLNLPPLVEDNSEDNILKNIGWVQGDEELFYYLKENMEISHLKANSVVTEQDSEDFNIYIIGSGVARLERLRGAFSVHVLDYLTTGNIVGEINFLTKAVRHKTVRCETAVTVLTLKEDMLEKMLIMNWNPDLPSVLYRMWLVIAKRVAIKVITEDPEYQGMSIEHMRMQMYHGYLIDDRLGTSIGIHADPSDTVILVHGYARDAFTRHPFRGPCFIPNTCFQLHLLPEEGLYTLVLVIPNEPIELEEYLISPTRRSSHVDASILALSASGTNAMRLEDVYKKAATANLRDESYRDSRKYTQQTELPEFASDSDSTSDSAQLLSSFNSSEYGKVSSTAAAYDREVIIPSPPSKQVEPSETRKVSSHLPAGMAWGLSDTWDDDLRTEHIQAGEHFSQTQVQSTSLSDD